jgi:hypothetical protein
MKWALQYREGRSPYPVWVPSSVIAFAPLFHLVAPWLPYVTMSRRSCFRCPDQAHPELPCFLPSFRSGFARVPCTVQYCTCWTTNSTVPLYEVRRYSLLYVSHSSRTVLVARYAWATRDMTFAWRSESSIRHRAWRMGGVVNNRKIPRLPAKRGTITPGGDSIGTVPPYLRRYFSDLQLAKSHGFAADWRLPHRPIPLEPVDPNPRRVRHPHPHSLSTGQLLCIS